ncbi:MAG: hypothetical protein WB783_15470 [Arenicellales bacterium]
MSTNEGSKHWLDDPRNVDKLVYALYAACAVLLGLDLVYDKHVHYAFEHWLGFYAWYGFGSYVGLIFVAKAFRRLVRRDEGYYDD